AGNGVEDHLPPRAIVSIDQNHGMRGGPVRIAGTRGQPMRPSRANTIPGPSDRGRGGGSLAIRSTIRRVDEIAVGGAATERWTGVGGAAREAYATNRSAHAMSIEATPDEAPAPSIARAPAAAASRRQPRLERVAPHALPRGRPGAVLPWTHDGA